MPDLIWRNEKRENEVQAQQTLWEKTKHPLRIPLAHATGWHDSVLGPPLIVSELCQVERGGKKSVNGLEHLEKPFHFA